MNEKQMLNLTLMLLDIDTLAILEKHTNCQ